MYAPDCPEAQEAWDKYHDYAHKECVALWKFSRLYQAKSLVIMVSGYFRQKK
jgi:hypothetical protein